VAARARAAPIAAAFFASQVCNALTRQRKEEIVADLKEKLENSVVVFGLRFKGLDVSLGGL
jgi:ribosomal protein L10